MGVPFIVVDTNVLVAGLRSRNGAAHQLLKRIGCGLFKIAISVPLVLEYEAVLLRQLAALAPLSAGDIGSFIDYLCAVGQEQEIFYLWRPVLADPYDEMVLELAVAARCEYLVTYNVRDFVGCDAFGVAAIPPGHFLAIIGAK